MSKFVLFLNLLLCIFSLSYEGFCGLVLVWFGLVWFVRFHNKFILYFLCFMVHDFTIPFCMLFSIQLMKILVQRSVDFLWIFPLCFFGDFGHIKQPWFQIHLLYPCPQHLILNI